MAKMAELLARGIIEVTGLDRVSFLQGLVSNDVEHAAPGHPVFAAFLTPQGKWLADFFIFAEPDRLLIDAEAGQIAMLLQKLSRFRLRMKVALVDLSASMAVYVGWGGLPPVGASLDPRLETLGWRMIAAPGKAATATTDDWDAHRLALGVPDGSKDLEAEKTVLLEAGYDELSGISWTKGCYMGQELTARTKYRGLLKRRLVRVTVDGELPAPGTPILRSGVDVGIMRSGRGAVGLAVLRLDAMGAELTAGDTRMRATPPSWMRLPEPGA
ncbi:MAG: folate-binding protein YgfZ [Acetobacteraceae bacterium]|nr:folate-binding protein YgfZ [Acetobacteraceae bacterium]